MKRSTLKIFSSMDGSPAVAKDSRHCKLFYISDLDEIQYRQGYWHFGEKRFLIPYKGQKRGILSCLPG